MRLSKYIFLTSLAAFSLGSCVKIEHLPPVPSIEFRSFTVFDSTDILSNNYKAGKLEFRFQDGDGDLGLYEPQAGETDTTNLFFKLLRETHGKMVLVPDNDLMKPSSYRIPYMDRTGQNKILRGTIEITFFYLNYDPVSTDTIQYNFNLKDRAGHYSNLDSTCLIPLSVNGIYTR